MVQVVEGGGLVSWLGVLILVVIYFPLAVISRIMKIQGGSATRRGRRRRRW